MEHLEVWYGQKQVERLPRLRGRNKVLINCRHVIDSLVREPGAFENYCYREELFSSLACRCQWDASDQRGRLSGVDRVEIGMQTGPTP